MTTPQNEFATIEPSSTKLAGVVFDTAGFDAGSPHQPWTVSLVSLNGPTELYARSDGLALPVVLIPGRISIVPEPYEFGLLAAFGLPGFGVYRRIGQIRR